VGYVGSGLARSLEIELGQALAQLKNHGLEAPVAAPTEAASPSPRKPAASGLKSVARELEPERPRPVATVAPLLRARLAGEEAAICFYPMSKRRSGDDNWYSLDFAARKELMAGHARVGRTYAGRVVQLITGSTGLDDWEWGVTLFADDPMQLKAIVYEMRFDEVSARYAEFGPFITGLVQEPADALGAVGIVGGAHRRRGR